MDGKRNLSAARKKLQEYKLSKGMPTGSHIVGIGPGTTFQEVNETAQQSSSNDYAVETSGSPNLPGLVPPPTQSIPEYLNNLSQDLQQLTSETKVLNVSQDSSSISPSAETTMSWSPEIDHGNKQGPFAPTAPLIGDDSLNKNTEVQHQEKYTDAGQNFPVNFFQSTPVAQEYQPVSFTSSIQQHGFVNNQPQVPLFCNVNGTSVIPLQPYQFEGSPANVAPTMPSKSSSSPSPLVDPEIGKPNQEGIVPSLYSQKESFSPETIPFTQATSPTAKSIAVLNAYTAGEVIDDTRRMHDDRQLIPDVQQVDHHHVSREVLVQRRTPTPTLRRVSVSSQDEKDRLEIQAFQRMKSVQDALELQLEELRRDNERLLHRQSELVSQIEDNEKNIQEIRRERDRCKEDAKKGEQPLIAKFNKLFEENQRNIKNSSDVGMELRSKLQDKTKQYEDMEHAFIIVSKSKMDLAAELDQEREKFKEIENLVLAKDEEIAQLQNLNAKLEEKVKIEQQKEAIIHQLEDQRHHFQVQSQTLQRELERANNKLRQMLPSTSMSGDEDVSIQPSQIDGTDDSHHHHENCSGHSHDEHEHPHSPDDHHHEHEHCDHSGHDHDHTGHDHHHEHDHSHGYDHNEHGDEHDHNETGIKRPPTNEFAAMKKRLTYLEWQNSELNMATKKYTSDAREKKILEAKCTTLTEECDKLRHECQRLELLVIQLQGENDTIGDYIALYQSQRLALKESAKEKDVQLENLAKEREVLLRRMEELTQLLKALKQSSTGTPNAPENSQHSCQSHQPDNTGHTEIEGQIRNLLSEISSSSLIENFHPCAVCSGRLMNV